MNKELNNFTHCSKLDLIKMYKKSRRDMRRLSRQKVELEQENAELKVSCKIQVDTAFQMIYEKDDQLTKAKEIIGNLFEIIKRPYQFTAPRKIQMVNEAEQFLKEIEK